MWLGIRDAEVGFRVKLESRCAAELRTDAESGVGVDPDAHADSAAKYDSEAGWGTCSESGPESGLRKSDSTRTESGSVRNCRRMRSGEDECGMGQTPRPTRTRRKV